MTKNQLKAARKRLNISQFALSKASGISRYNISMFETGYRKLTQEETSKIEKILSERSK